MELIERVICDTVLDAAYGWLCDRRLDYNHNNDVWHLRRDWSEEKPREGSAASGTLHSLAMGKIINEEDQ